MWYNSIENIILGVCVIFNIVILGGKVYEKIGSVVRNFRIFNFGIF